MSPRSQSDTPVIISRETLRAYERTAYRVALAHAPFALRVGVRSGAIDELHRRAGVSASVFVTACNPFGRRRSGAWNAQAMARLRASLDRSGVVWIAGEGEGDDANWPAEPGVLALGASAHDAQRLCVEFEQNAVVVIADDAIPRLLFHPRAVLPPRER